MKISNLQKFAWVFFALVLTTTTVFSQGWRNGNRNVQSQNDNCVNSITGLTEKQQKQITEMEESHHKSMAELRENRRATTNAIEKNEIRGDMLKKVEAHRKAVKKVLSEEQQKQYEQLHAFGNNGRNQNIGNSGYYGNFQGRRGNNTRQNFTQGNNTNRNKGRGNGRFIAQNNCMNNTPVTGNFRGRGANFQNGRGNGNGYQAGLGNNGNNFRGRNANYTQGNGNFRRGNGNIQGGNGRFYWQNNACSGNHDINEEGFEVIEEQEFKEN